MTEEGNYNAKQCKYEKLSVEFENFSVHKLKKKITTKKKELINMCTMILLVL